MAWQDSINKAYEIANKNMEVVAEVKAQEEAEAAKAIEVPQSINVGGFELSTSALALGVAAAIVAYAFME